MKRTALKYEGDFMLRRKRSKIHVWVILVLLIHISGYFFNGRFQVYPVIGWSSLFIFEVVINLLTRKFKPVAIVVKGNSLSLINFLNTNRELTTLKSISLDGFSDHIKITFHNQKPLWIRRDEYEEADIDNLVRICKLKSESVSVSANLAV